MALKVSRRVARFNRVVTNPVQSRYAWLVPPWAIVCHVGRRSGRRYRTPVLAFRRGHTVAIDVLYGEESDWVQNLLAAGGGQVVRAGRTFDVVQPRLVDPRSEAVPRLAAPVGRLTGKVLLARLGRAQPGFGRGPASD